MTADEKEKIRELRLKGIGIKKLQDFWDYLEIVLEDSASEMG